MEMEAYPQPRGRLRIRAPPIPRLGNKLRLNELKIRARWNQAAAAFGNAECLPSRLDPRSGEPAFPRRLRPPWIGLCPRAGMLFSDPTTR